MTVVADASVLIGLSSIGCLSLLHQRFPEGVLVPQAVWREVVEQGRGRPGGREVAEADWITAYNVSALEIVKLLQVDLDAGETEVIALAHQMRAKLVLLDERNARRAAKQLGLHVLGTIGILIWAKRNGGITSLGAALDALGDQAQFRFSQQLYEQALRVVDEL